ncbi:MULTISPECIES: hypothetical protein [unclassified Nostoc]|uniref:hypothetical protein n=1 Tax=unclassified Nostoc TaxID=2593658 RepID=UPI002AD42ECA|nr:hypothetical protein [Nostoc sp. DedQUE03]MDZ7975752.1 hypothetical protein [Nostoc sp. DedQUE03]MDZ8048284.1 hypothetical protein [Nostoc sp. DedQUE02]
MNTTQSTIAVTNSSPQGVTLTLEGTGIILGILVSVSVLSGVAYKVITSVNKISLSIENIEKEMNSYAGHAKQITDLSHRVDLHIQDYVNRKDTITLLVGGLKEVLEHRTNRLYTSMKDIEAYLQKSGTFKIREFQDLRDMNEDKPFDKL